MQRMMKKKVDTEAMMIPNQMKEKISKIRVMIMCKCEEVEQCKDKKYVYWHW